MGPAPADGPPRFREITMIIGKAKLVGCVALVGTVLGASGCAVDTTESAADGESTAQGSEALAYGTWGKFVQTSSGRCLDVRGGSLAGTAQIFDCTGASNQLWTFSNPDGPIFTHLNSAYSLTNNPSYNYFSLAKYAIGASAQSFTMSAPQFQSATGYCLGYVAPWDSGEANAANVVNCAGYEALNFTYDESLRPIKNRNGLCLTGGTVSGANAYFDTCNKANQNWQLSSNGSIRQNGLCLDVRGGVGYPNAQVQVYGCNGGGNQSWSIKGQLMLQATGACLMTPNTNNQQQVELSSCAYAPNTQWQFKW
jgi:hypothetical protein